MTRIGDPGKKKKTESAPAQATVVDEEVCLDGTTPTIDLHADTPMHGLPLCDDEVKPSKLMRAWQKTMKAFAPNFFRHVTRETLDVQQRGLQTFSITTEGFPPLFRESHKFYTQRAGARPKHANDTGFNTLIDQAAWIYREVQKNPDRLALVTSYADAVRAINENKVAVRIGLEGAGPLLPREGDAEALEAFLKNDNNQIPKDMPLPTKEELATTAGRVQYLRRLGVVYVGLNHLNSSAYSGSDMIMAMRRGAGLSEAGRNLICELNQAGILVDVAHASQATQRDVIGLSTLPLLVSHGVVNADGGDVAWREINDDLLREVKRTGGVVGVMFAKVYLENGTVDDIVDQIDHIKKTIGIDYVAFGSDADGFVEMAIPSMGHIESIVEALRRRGYSEEEIHKIRFANALRVFRTLDAANKSQSLGALATPVAIGTALLLTA